MDPEKHSLDGQDDKERDLDLDLDHDHDLEKGGVGHPSILNKTHNATFESQGPSRLRLQTNKTLERTYSVAPSIRGPARVEAGAKVPGEFKTLSLQLSQGGLNDRIERKKREQKTVKELSELDWHSISAEDALKRLGSAADAGLDTSQAERRLKQYGRNEMSKPPNRWARKLFGYVFGGFGPLLVAGAIVCFIAWKPLGNPHPQVSNLALACVLVFVVVLQAAFNAHQDWSTGRVMESIAGMLPEAVIVVRDGQKHSIPAAELVQGDVVVISLGCKVAADCRIIACSDAKFDRSVVTGEADAVAGSVDMTEHNYLETRNIALAGTSCVNGSALGLVVATGDNTVFGRIAKMTNRPRTGLTTLEREVRLFVYTIAAIAIGVAVVCVIFWAAYLRPRHPDFMSTSALLVNVVSILVAFIPEGMPIAVTLSLTVTARKMAKAKILCKQLSTCETLGAITVLCSDKTGTLTSNRMTVTSVGVHGFTSDPLDARDHMTTGGPLASAFTQLQLVGAVCNAATFDAASCHLPVRERTVHGDATDTAILKMAEEMASGVERLSSAWTTRFQLAFNSKNKFMLKLVRASDAGAASRAISIAEAERFDAERDLILLAKGGPDVLLKRSAYALDASGEVVPLTDEIRQSLMATQAAWSSRGQRVILLARRIVTSTMIDTSLPIEDAAALALNVDLTVVGLVGIVDPPRPEIPEVVRTCRGAGIRFFMVTGDFQLTAEAIARQCGIVTAEKVDRFDALSTASLPEYDTFADGNDTRPQRALSLTGSDLMQMAEAQWEQCCRYDEIVFSRTTPEQKLRIVKEFQARGGCVGMTGDGVNDAPSLKQADIGIAMGGGSSVAMEAADMVLLESFASIVDALVFGRLVFCNLKKTVAYLLPAGTFAELWAVLLSFFFGLPQILSNLQMIFVSVGTDVLPSLSLCLEKPESDLLKRKPRNVRTDRLADWRLLTHAYLFVGLPVTAASCAMGFWWMQRHGVPFSDMWLRYGGGRVQTESPALFNEVLYQANAVYFFNLILMQWFNLLGWRTQKLSSLFQQPPIGNARTQNLALFPAMAFALVLAVFLSYIPALQRVFLTRGVSVEHFFLPMAFGATMLLVEEGRKYLVRRYPRGVVAKMAW
ncbi:uncharacterized protein PFL1_01803 [Pseudozyma flocculosa PF-1]|nr:uncharacterized protein PFL1_01803 [Pseudozyma flocculosa PF-1]EPQ30905.1 hypothetical protein PFL1_01803 [Pseudozyma flocculosa PF-1]